LERPADSREREREREREGGEGAEREWSIIDRTICSGEGCSLSITIPLFLLAIYLVYREL